MTRPRDRYGRFSAAAAAIAAVTVALTAGPSAQAQATLTPPPPAGPPTEAAGAAPPASAKPEAVGLPPSGPSLAVGGRYGLDMSLYHSVDVTLSDATIRQMAETLSKSTGLHITVDPSIPEQTRITVEAHRVPLVTLLDAVCRQADVLIAPEEGTQNGKVVGLLLTRPSVLKVNGQTQFVGEGGTFPWSAEWGIPPTALLGAPPASGTIAPTSLTTVPTQASLPPQSIILESMPTLAQGGFVPSPASTTLGLVAVGSDLIVVAEAGSGEKGEPGAWLTVYRLQKDGKGMTRLGSTFHAYRSGPTAAPTGSVFGHENKPAGDTPAEPKEEESEEPKKP